MDFFHSFPRWFASRTDQSATIKSSSMSCVLSRGADTLSSISKYGLLCTPEWLPFSSRVTQTLGGSRPIAFSDLGKLSQSRFCVTALGVDELYVRRGQKHLEQAKPTIPHAEAFGPFTIGFSNQTARRIGFMPTIYYSAANSQGDLSVGPKYWDLGVNLQLLQSLHDLRNIVKSLLVLEHAYAKYDTTTDLHALDISDMLEASGSELPAAKMVSSLSKDTLDLLTEPFNFQRLPALYLLDHLEIVLTLFQSSDDLKAEVPLDYFQQREWRLVQHFRRSLYWYSLGDHADHKDENRLDRRQQRAELAGKIGRNKEYLNACWVLESVDGILIRNLVSFVSLPNRSLDLIDGYIADLFPQATFVPAEELGFSG